MPYATYEDFAARYGTRVPAAEVNSHVLPFAAARLEAQLAPAFTVPFSANNRTATDLTVDLAYLLVLQRSKAPQDAEALRATLEARLARLRRGEEAMLTDSGAVLFAASPQGDVWSNTAPYHPVFGLRDASAQTVDPQRLTDEEQEP